MRQNEIYRIKLEKDVKEYLENGGKIEELPPFEQDMNCRKVKIDDGRLPNRQPS